MSGALGFQAKRALARSVAMTDPVQRALFSPEHLACNVDPTSELVQYRSTRYETVRQLLDHLGSRLRMGHWVEPCAGEGHIVRHVARWCDENEKPRPSFWTCIELRAEPALGEMVAYPSEVTRNHGRVWIYSPQDLLTFQEQDDGVAVVITNMPWYGWTERGLFESMRWLWPQAEIVLLTCMRELLDGPRNEETGRPARPQWLAKNRPNRILWCAGRQAFGQKSTYPHPVAWLHWERGVTCAKQTIFEVLR